MVFNMMGYYNGMWYFGFITWFLTIVILVLLIMFLIKQIQKPNRK